MVADSTEASVEVVAIVGHHHRHRYGREVLQTKLPQTTICRLRPWRKYDQILTRLLLVRTAVYARTAQRAPSSIATFTNIVLHILQHK